MTQQLPARIQAELDQAQALLDADQAARILTPAVTNVADLTLQPSAPAVVTPPAPAPAGACGRRL